MEVKPIILDRQNQRVYVVTFNGVRWGKSSVEIHSIWFDKEEALLMLGHVEKYHKDAKLYSIPVGKMVTYLDFD